METGGSRAVMNSTDRPQDDLPDRLPDPGWRTWVHEHDDRRLFVLSYVTLAVTLSILISLFWLVVVVAIHAAMEWYRQSRLAAGGGSVPLLVAWELKLDIALILLAAVMAVYMEFILGMAGLGGAARLGAHGAQGAARAIGWTRGLRGVLMSLDDAAQLVRMRGPSKSDPPPSTNPGSVTTNLRPWHSPGVGDRISIGLAAASAAALLASPLLSPLGTTEVISLLASEFHPWPAD